MPVRGELWSPLTTHDPLANASSMFRALDSLAGRAGTTTAHPVAGMPMDAYRIGDDVVAHLDLPGVDPGSIEMTLEGTTLTTSAERDTACQELRDRDAD